MRYLSVCSGIEAATVAWHDMGWEAAAFSEIEKFPSQVLHHHYPTVPNVGDMTKYKEWDIGSIGLLVGGTPCQSFSVAGLRKGLDDPRGNLALVYCGILDHFRPKWFVWENVPGVLSSNGGRDFGSFLGALAQLGYGFAYRVLDAQWFGVAQRRRRVFVVGHIGSWQRAAAVLFESSSLRRDTQPSRETRKGTTPSSQSSPTYGGSNAECADTVTSKRAKGSGGPSGNEGGLFVAHTLRAKHNAGEDGTGRGTPLVPVEIPEVMSTLLSSTAGISRPGNAVTEHETYIPMAFAQNTRDEVRWVNGDGQIVGALAAESGMKQTTYVAQPIAWDEELNPSVDIAGTLMRGGQGGRHDGVMQPIAFGVGESQDVAHCLRSQGSKADKHESTTYAIQTMAVRRLTPVECERLQGFPDNYTNIRENCPDGPRYKALGNSMAVPVMKWIGQRIQAVEEL